MKIKLILAGVLMMIPTLAIVLWKGRWNKV